MSKRRANLMEKYPFCYWCAMYLVYVKIDGGPLPDDFPTIDHINSRLMHPDGRPKVGVIVLSCPGCNQDRNRQEQVDLGVEELRRRSGRGRYTIMASTMSSSSLSEFSSPCAQSGDSRDPIALARSENKVRASSI